MSVNAPLRHSAAFQETPLLDVTIVMPCLNEIVSLPHCISNAKDALARIEALYGLAGEIVIADNGSDDGSQELAAQSGARVVPVTQRGYGAALIGGCEAAFGRFILMGDADGSYDFTDGVAMIGQLLEGADLCMGSRFEGGIMPGAMPWKNRYIGNPVLTGILNLFFRSGVSDAHCGLRAITKEAFQSLRLSGTGMEFASEMVIKASLKKLRITEVPATLSKDLRDRAPHLRPWRDGWRHLRYLLMLSPTWAFGVPGMMASVFGLLIFAFAVMEAIVPGSFPAVGNYWVILAAAMLNAGHLAALLAVAAQLYGIQQGYRIAGWKTRKLAKILSLETMLAAGIAFFGLGVAMLLAVFWQWAQRHFGPIYSVLPAVLGTTAVTIGLQTVMGGFLLAILGGNVSRFLYLAYEGARSSNLRQVVHKQRAASMLEYIHRSPRYAGIAVICALLHNAIIIGFDLFGLHYALSLMVSAAVLLPTGYVLQSIFTFGISMTWRNFVIYSIALITNYPVSLATLWLLCDIIRLKMLYAAPISALVLFVWNFGTSQWALGVRSRNGAAATSD